MGNSAYHKKDELEFFPTQEWVKEALYSMMNGTEKKILDPCCGDGGLEYFGKYEYKLMDIEDRGLDNVELCDFLKREPKEGEHYDCAVINPPFGLTNEFITQAFKYTDDIYLIAPFKSVFKKWNSLIVDSILDWRIPYQCFAILTSVGLMHLKNKKQFTFGAVKNIADAFWGQELPYEKSWKQTFFVADKAPDKWFIVNRLTKARVQRNEELIQEKDIYAPNDESAFIVEKGNTNTKAGDKIKRDIMLFDSKEDAYTFRQKYLDNSDYVRNYCYLYGGTILDTRKIPLL